MHKFHVKMLKVLQLCKTNWIGKLENSFRFSDSKSLVFGSVINHEILLFTV